MTSRAVCSPVLLMAAALFAGSSLSAQEPVMIGSWGVGVQDGPAPKWRAAWIWLPGDKESDMLLARKTFSLTEIPPRAMMFVTAGSRYQLFINGVYIGRGPARCAPHHQSFDTLDVTSFLKEGKNAIAIRVHYQRDDVSYYELSRAGLLAQLQWSTGAQVSTVHTDDSWRVHRDDAWQDASPRIARFHLDVCDRMDLRREDQGWKNPGFDDRSWSEARVLRREIGWPLPQKNDRGTHLTPPWTSLVARDIPYLVERGFVSTRPAHVGSVPALQGATDFDLDEWVEAPAISPIPMPQRPMPLSERIRNDTQASLPLPIAANEPGHCRVIVFDLGEVKNGRPFLDLQAPAGTVVDIMSAPYLLDHSFQVPIVASTYVDRIVLSSQRERWDAFYMKPVRWMALVFRHLPGDARLFQAGVMRSIYPFERRQGSFQTPDFPELQTLWEAAAKTIQVCTTDAYTDNYRERRQYAQTSYYACLGNYSVFGDRALQRRYLMQIAEEQLANGIMPAYAPRHGDDFMVILDSNCFWVRGLHQYLLHSGDLVSTRKLLPAARKLLALQHSFTNSDGLIENPPYPYWLDHTLNDRRGANFCLNSHYLGALEDFAQVLQWMDEPDSSVYSQQADRIREALREQLWDPDRQLFSDAIVDAKRSDQFSEHANAMALALRIATPDQMKAVAAQLSNNERHDFVRRDSGIIMVTPAMSHFLHAGLCEAGCADRSWELLWDRFSHMVTPETNGTLWEEWWLDGSGRSGTFKPIASGRSDAQTESAFCPGLFARYILGVEPSQPGLCEVVLRYHDSKRLLRRRGAVPTPRGPLAVAWDITPTEFGITLQTPPATTVLVDRASLNDPSPGHITVNGEAVSATQLRGSFVVIPSGIHVIRIRRS